MIFGILTTRIFRCFNHDDVPRTRTHEQNITCAPNIIYCLQNQYPKTVQSNDTHISTQDITHLLAVSESETCLPGIHIEQFLGWSLLPIA